MLVGNQRHSINAIASHVQIRKNKVSRMPADASREILGLFPPLEKRVSRQKRAFAGISWVVFGVVVLTTIAVADANSSGSVIEWLHSYITEIGRASCRERLCQYGEISVVAVSFKKKKKKKK